MNYEEIYHANFICAVKDKMKTDGDIQAVKFVRQQTGMSLIQAKKFIDFCHASEK